MRPIRFAGFQKTSLIDFPGRVASVLFTPGCNLRCPFCHNWRLILEPRGPFLLEEDALKILESRKRYVDAVVVTGGEPTLYEDLPIFLRKLKERGFAVKLDTNGFFPQMLERCLAYVDYVAVDVKTSLEKYPLLGANNTSDFLRTIDLIKYGKTDYEFRTTVVPGFVDEEDIAKIGEVIKGSKHFVFQQFVPGDTLDKKFNEVKPYPSEAIGHFAEVMKKYVDKVTLRT